MSAKTTIDWFRFRTQATPVEALEALRPLFGDPGRHLRLVDAGKGLLGFQSGALIMMFDMPVARIDYGGEHQRGWARVELSGKGCSWITDWDALEEVEGLPEAEPRRLDIALTTWEGEITHEMLVQAHDAGRFECGGRPPHMQQITSSNPRAGRTCYVGKREKADKFLRGYEKGLEMLSKMPDSMAANVTHIDGFKVEDIYRVEVEFKTTTRPLDWAMVDNRDQYFAGAYPFCGDVLPGVEADILQRRPERQPQTDLAVALAHCRMQYGRTLFTALHAYEGDISEVWRRICGTDHNEALVEAGVLLVEHRG
jgi:DNA relaxase NicK